jgi:hypothetical protein
LATQLLVKEEERGGASQRKGKDQKSPLPFATFFPLFHYLEVQFNVIGRDIF